jgi:1-acyl-sn-glycerol-3-phosphate acyltransferase
VKKAKKTWTKFHHRVVRNVVMVFLYPYIHLRYRIEIERFRQQGKRPYLILLNHQTPFDQFFVGLAFRGPVYYMATEDIFSLGWVSKLLRWAIAPIPIKKQTTDVQAVLNCMRVVKEGGTVCIAPEGNRTYSGRTMHMNPAIAPLAKKLKLPIALFRIEGGYGAEPRWSDVVRRGKMKAYVSQVLEPKAYAEMTDEQLYDWIRTGLDVREDCITTPYYHKRSAEFLDRMLYVCPTCGLATFYARKDTVRCQSCGLQARYLPSKELEGVPFRFVYDWYRYQEEFVNALDLKNYPDKPLFQDWADVSEVIVYQRKNLLRKQAEIKLYADRIAIDEEGSDPLVLPFAEIATLAVLGRNKINIYHDKRVYQVKGDKHFNGLKYVHFCYRYKNLCKEAADEQFLGL